MDSSSSRRRALPDLDDGGGDLEEGEYVPGNDDDDESSDTHGGFRFEPRRREGEVQHQEQQLGQDHRATTLPRGVAPSCESDGTTISDDDDGSNSTHSGATSSVISVPPRRFACTVCGRRFFSPKAVDGHMRVHANGRSNNVAAAAVLSGGWAATGKRGWTGGKPPSSVSVSLNSESTDPVVAAALDVPVPMAVAIPSLSATPVVSARTNLSSAESSSASAQPTMHHEPVATVAVTGPDPSGTGAAAVHQQQAAPPTPAEQAHPVHHQQPAVPPPPPAQQAQLVQHLLVPPPPPPPASPAAQAQREYSCKLCGKTYTSHQGLGGHAAGHRNRQKEAEAAAAAAGMLGPDGDAFLAALRRGGKAEQPHECQRCHKVFPTGVALGGHMRMHYTGPPIVHRKNKKMRLVTEADLRLALSTITAAPPSPAAPAVAGTGRVRLFGIDIGPKEQAPPSEQQGFGAAEGSSPSGQQGSRTAEGSSSAGEQQ